MIYIIKQKALYQNNSSLVSICNCKKAIKSCIGMLKLCVVSNCILGLFWWRYFFFYWLLQSFTGDWVKIHWSVSSNNPKVQSEWKRTRSLGPSLQTVPPIVQSDTDHPLSRRSYAGTAKKFAKKRDSRAEWLFRKLSLLLFLRSSR